MGLSLPSHPWPAWQSEPPPPQQSSKRLFFGDRYNVVDADDQRCVRMQPSSTQWHITRRQGMLCCCNGPSGPPSLRPSSAEQTSNKMFDMAAPRRQPSQEPAPTTSSGVRHDLVPFCRRGTMVDLKMCHASNHPSTIGAAIHTLIYPYPPPSARHHFRNHSKSGDDMLTPGIKTRPRCESCFSHRHDLSRK